MENVFPEKLSGCSSFADIFELVKEAVEEVLGKSRAGLMLGLADLGGSRQSYLGAYYPVGSNIIVMNSFPLKRIRQTKKELLKPYVFTVLLHEYLHSLGYLDESAVRTLTFRICNKLFGSAHLATDLARDITKFLPHFAYPDFGWFPQEHPQIQLVEGFDKGHLTYVT